MPDQASPVSLFSINSQNGELHVAKQAGDVEIEAIFIFNAKGGSPENMAWHIVIDLISKNADYLNGQKYLLIVDSDLDSLEAYNRKTSPYFLQFYLPDNISLQYASADGSHKNNSLMNYAINHCEENAKAICAQHNAKIAAAVTVEYLNENTRILSELNRLKYKL